jgi:S1-C subfamily serine protease
VVVKKIKQGVPLSNTRMDPGFIITSVNGNEIKNVDELAQLLAGGYDQLQLEGIYPGYSGVYTYKIDLDEE